MNKRTGTEQHRLAVQLATQVLATANRARATCVLLTSAEPGAGKTALAERMRLGLVSAGFQRHMVLDWNELKRVDPHSIPVDSFVFIDGPALHSGVDILSVPPGWRARITGSIVVVMKRKTSRAAVADIVTWLQAAGWPPIGLVWNEHAFPRWGLLERLFRGRRPRLSPPVQSTEPPVATPAPDAYYDEMPSKELFTEAEMDGRIVQPTEPPKPEGEKGAAE